MKKTLKNSSRIASNAEEQLVNVTGRVQVNKKGLAGYASPYYLYQFTSFYGFTVVNDINDAVKFKNIQYAQRGVYLLNKIILDTHKDKSFYFVYSLHKEHYVLVLKSFYEK